MRQPWFEVSIHFVRSKTTLSHSSCKLNELFKQPEGN